MLRHHGSACVHRWNKSIDVVGAVASPEAQLARARQCAASASHRPLMICPQGQMEGVDWEQISQLSGAAGAAEAARVSADRPQAVHHLRQIPAIHYATAKRRATIMRWDIRHCRLCSRAMYGVYADQTEMNACVLWLCVTSCHAVYSKYIQNSMES